MKGIVRSVTLALCGPLSMSAFAQTAEHDHGHTGSIDSASGHDGHSHSGHSQSNQSHAGHSHGTLPTKPVELYGMLYLSVDHNDPGKAGEVNTYLDSDGTIVGLRGAKPLDYGLTAFWQIESTIDLTEQGDANHSELAGHDSFLGIAGNWGALRGGKFYSPYSDATHHFDIFHHVAGDYRLMLGNVADTTSGTGSHHGGIFHVIASDIIAYKTPDLNGLTAQAAVFGFNETTGVPATGDTSAYSASVTYQNKGFMATAAYEQHKNFDTYTGGATNVVLDKSEASMVGAMYGWRNTTVAAIYETIDVSDTDTANAPNASRDAYYANVEHAINRTRLKLAYGMADDFRGDDGGEFVAAGVSQFLGESTQAYLIYVGVDNEAQGEYGTFKVNPFMAGSDPSTVSVGLIHAF